MQSSQGSCKTLTVTETLLQENKREGRFYGQGQSTMIIDTSPLLTRLVGRVGSRTLSQWDMVYTNSGGTDATTACTKHA